VRVVLLIGSPADLDISQALYANNLVALGHEVRMGALNALSADGVEIRCPMGEVTQWLEAYAPFTADLRRCGFSDVDLVWLLNQPYSRIAADVWQLLWRLNQQVPFVNDVTGLMMLNNKNNLPLLVQPEHLPATLISNDFGEVWQRYQSESQSPWVVKPPNAGCGADVFVLEPHSTNNRALLQSMTGNTSANAAMTRGGVEGLRAQYCALQRFVPHTQEKRIILVGGRPVAQQTKQLAAGEHRGNVSQRAKPSVGFLTDEERQLAHEVGERLIQYGIRFAGIDMAYPVVFEVNLVNPGGLNTPLQLGLPDTSREHIAQILAAVPGIRPATTEWK
jgi:glutathione synthase